MTKPRLFHVGRNGLSAEMRSAIVIAETAARLARGAKAYSGAARFYAEGVDWICQDLLGKLRSRIAADKAKLPPKSQVKRRQPELTDEMKVWLYGLHAYCAEWKQCAPDLLLRLTFDALGLAEGRFLAGVESDPDAWLEAAALDGEAEADGTTLTATELGQKVGVSRDTISRWRKTKEYQGRRAYCCWAKSKAHLTRL
jgi:hypothetical protein